MKNNDKKPRQPLGRVFSNNFRMIVKVFRLAPDYFAAMMLYGIAWGLIHSSQAVFTLRLFNSLDEGASFTEVATIIGIMAIFYLIVYGIDAACYHCFMPILRQKLELRLHKELFLKAQTIDISCYDDPEFYNDFVWSMDEAGARAYQLLNDLYLIVMRVIAGGTLIGLLFSIDSLVAVVLLITSIFTIIINQMGNKLYFEQEKEWKPLRRVRDYLNRVYHLPDYAKEIRISHVTDIFMDKMDENRDKMVETSVRYGRKFFLIYGVGDTLLSNLVYYGILFYMFASLLDGNVLIGGFSASIGMIGSVRWSLGDFVRRLSKFPQHSLFLEKYYEFLSYEPKTKSGERPVPSFDSLELREVSFTYDFSNNPKYAYHDKDYTPPKVESKEKSALEGINMRLERGEKIAIVGYNGAGKTTLIKLLMRLYDPTEGAILLNGVNIKEYELTEYRNCIGTVFQDFKIFAASIAENVMNGIYDEKRDKETVLRALDAAGFTEKLNTLDDGVDTVLTREFDDKGTNLSGGEAQKVAIARVFAKPFELIIMDEPSSALDPVAEYELNQAILRYAADKTVIFISHRLSTTRMADRIYMFDSGTLAEVGSHDDLMAQNGKYAEMFNLQAEKYKE
ncbi:MAG: ABC transporter ATP-binding protein [Clostridia bacterium]|nr:ABC transporter ATP-binding protein [Clostridia bacterium]